MYTSIHTVHSVCTYVHQNTLHSTVNTVPTSEVWWHSHECQDRYGEPSVSRSPTHSHNMSPAYRQCVISTGCHHHVTIPCHHHMSLFLVTITCHYPFSQHLSCETTHLTCASISVYHRPSNPGAFSALFLSALALFFASLSVFSSSYRCSQEPLNGVVSMCNIVCYNFSDVLRKN